MLGIGPRRTLDMKPVGLLDCHSSASLLIRRRLAAFLDGDRIAAIAQLIGILRTIRTSRL